MLAVQTSGFIFTDLTSRILVNAIKLSYALIIHIKQLHFFEYPTIEKACYGKIGVQKLADGLPVVVAGLIFCKESSLLLAKPQHYGAIAIFMLWQFEQVQLFETFS